MGAKTFLRSEVENKQCQVCSKNYTAKPVLSSHSKIDKTKVNGNGKW